MPEDRSKTAEFAANLQAAKPAQFPTYFPPMLASLAENPFSRGGWIYEPKMDGMRCIAFVDGDKVKLLSRRGQNITSQYPALAEELPGLCKSRLVLDGEIIALNSEGKPSFQLLQKRMNLLKVQDISRADQNIPVHFFVFDTVYAGNYNIAACSLLDRKKVLHALLQPSDRVIILQHFSEDGELAYRACIENGFEGIVAKRTGSPYEMGRRSPSWIKVKAQQSSEFVICGYSPGQGSRSATFGSLILGFYDSENRLHYAGSVGSGFDERLLAEMLRRMSPLKIEQCPLLQKPDDKKDAVWLKPELVAEIKFMDWTDDRHLRNPVFLHLRQDIQAINVRMISPLSQKEIENIDKAAHAENRGIENPELIEHERVKVELKKTVPERLDSLKQGSETDELEKHEPEESLDLEIKHWQSISKSVLAQLGGKERGLTLSVDHESIKLSNLDKTLYPATETSPAITKRDFLRLLAFLGPYILTHLQYRPLTMIRAPSGLRSRSFYQKHWNLDIPDFIETLQTEPEDPSRKDQLLCNNMQALLFLAQHNILEYHCWLSRMKPHWQRCTQGDERADISLLEYPDFMVFDIDIHKEESEKESNRLDKDAFKKASEAAFILQEILNQIKLPSYLKTSGRNGLHVFIPIKRKLKFDELRTLAETIARHIESQNPQKISTSAVAAKKSGKVFLDYQANTRGKTLAAAYSPRLTPTGSISTPLKWSELDKVYPEDFNQQSICDRIAANKDIWKEILKDAVDLESRFNTKA